MKKGKVILIYLCFFLLVILCISLTALNRNPIYIYLLFRFVFFVSLLFIPIYFRRFRKEYERQKEYDSDEMVEEINDTAGYNKMQYDVQQIKAVVDTWKKATPADIIKGILFVSFFFGCVIGAMVCLSLGYIKWGLIFFGAGALEMIIALIVVKSLERRSLKLKGSGHYIRATAEVLYSTLSSQSSVGSRNKKRITNTTYKVFLQINDEQRKAYSREYYKPGTKVNVNIDEKNPNIIHIL